MSTDVSLICPVQPHEMDKALRFGMEDIVRRVVCAALAKVRGEMA